ncbi:MAG: hypothetical protein ACRDQZ_20150, partial [Mycobacteriales bacterium]
MAETGDIVGQSLLGRRLWIAPADQGAAQWLASEPGDAPTSSSLPSSAWLNDFHTHARDLSSGLAALRGRGPLAPSQIEERSRQLLGRYSDVVGPRPPEDATDQVFLTLS